jgi:predicted nucleotidyltransferase
MGTRHSSTNGLAGALFSKVQLNVLGLLIGQPDRAFPISEIIRLAKSGSGAVQRELGRLTQAGIVNTSYFGKRKLYQANRQSPIFSELHGLVLKTAGLIEPLKRALKPLQMSIDFAFVYGSIANGTDTASSDIDLMILGDKFGYTDAFAALQSVEKSLNRPVHPNLMTLKEWKSKRRSNNAFVTKVSEQPKLFVFGSDDELQRIG